MISIGIIWQFAGNLSVFAIWVDSFATGNLSVFANWIDSFATRNLSVFAIWVDSFATGDLPVFINDWQFCNQESASFCNLD